MSRYRAIHSIQASSSRPQQLRRTTTTWALPSRPTALILFKVFPNPKTISQAKIKSSCVNKSTSSVKTLRWMDLWKTTPKTWLIFKRASSRNSAIDSQSLTVKNILKMYRSQRRSHRIKTIRGIVWLLEQHPHVTLRIFLAITRSVECPFRAKFR